MNTAVHCERSWSWRKRIFPWQLPIQSHSALWNELFFFFSLCCASSRSDCLDSKHFNSWRSEGGSELGRYWLICLCTDTKLNTSTQHSITLHNQIARRGWQLELFSLLLRTLFQEEIKNQFSFLLFCLLQLGSTVKNAQSITFSFDLQM